MVQELIEAGLTEEEVIHKVQVLLGVDRDTARQMYGFETGDPTADDIVKEEA